MDETAQWMRVLGMLAMLSPFMLGQIPILRPYARRVGLVAALLYIGLGVGFVLWWTLIRTPPA